MRTLSMEYKVDGEFPVIDYSEDVGWGQLMDFLSYPKFELLLCG